MPYVETGGAVLRLLRAQLWALAYHFFCANRSDMAMQSKNPFILVLIDGDGYLFEDDYLKNAESGGGDAAHRLLSAVQDYVKMARLQGLSSDPSIMVNIYGNKRGLTGALLEAEIITHPRDLENFFCKFTQSHTHFQYIDCGPGKERADAKLRGPDHPSCFRKLLC
jgi:hypothetical protein